jgi:hypothetical protein
MAVIDRLFVGNREIDNNGTGKDRVFSVAGDLIARQF